MSLVEKIEEYSEDIGFFGVTLLGAAGAGLYDGLIEDGGLECEHGRIAALEIASFYGLIGITSGIIIGVSKEERKELGTWCGKKLFEEKRKPIKNSLKYASLLGTLMVGIPAACYLAGRSLGCLARQVC